SSSSEALLVSVLRGCTSWSSRAGPALPPGCCWLLLVAAGCCWVLLGVAQGNRAILVLVRVGCEIRPMAPGTRTGPRDPPPPARCARVRRPLGLFGAQTFWTWLK